MMILKTLKKIVDFVDYRKENINISSLCLSEQEEVEVLCRHGFCFLGKSAELFNNDLRVFSVVLPTELGRKVINIIYPSLEGLFLKILPILAIIIIFIVLWFSLERFT